MHPRNAVQQPPNATKLDKHLAQCISFWPTCCGMETGIGRRCPENLSDHSWQCLRTSSGLYLRSSVVKSSIVVAGTFIHHYFTIQVLAVEHASEQGNILTRQHEVIWAIPREGLNLTLNPANVCKWLVGLGELEPLTCYWLQIKLLKHALSAYLNNKANV